MSSSTLHMDLDVELLEFRELVKDMLDQISSDSSEQTAQSVIKGVLEVTSKDSTKLHNVLDIVYAKIKRSIYWHDLAGPQFYR